jgi:hypothetical protein
MFKRTMGIKTMKLKVGDRVLVKARMTGNITIPATFQVLEGRIVERSDIFYKGWMILIKEWKMEGKFPETHIVPITETASENQIKAMKVLFK